MEKMNKILFIRLSSLGDVVLTESTIRLTKQAFPDCQVHYLTKPEYADLVKTFKYVDKILRWENKIKLMQSIRQENYDYIIDLHNKFNTFMIKKLAGSKNIITYNKQHFLRRMIIAGLTGKQIDTVVWNYVKTIKKLPNSNIDIDKIEIDRTYYPKLEPDPDIMERVKEILFSYKLTHDLPLIGIFPGATHHTKQLPLTKLANFILSIPEEWECNIAILGTYKEKMHAITLKSITEEKLFDLTGVFSPSQLPAVISMMDFVITNDSGPMHIAAALQKRQIAIFGATHTSLGFRPLNDKARIIQKNIKCQPCSLHGGRYCRKDHFKCMHEIHSEEVYNLFAKDFVKLMING